MKITETFGICNVFDTKKTESFRTENEMNGRASFTQEVYCLFANERTEEHCCC